VIKITLFSFLNRFKNTYLLYFYLYDKHVDVYNIKEGGKKL